MSASATSISVSTLGVPLIGPRRELEFALEKHWSGKTTADDLLAAAAGLRVAHWPRQHSAAITIIQSIGKMDAYVISIETSRSRMELLDAFVTYHYPNEIGPGVYDIHSPRIPAAGEMAELLHEARKRLSADQLWVNPDCGLKTRKWDEVRPALENMVEAARSLQSGGGGA